MNNDWQSWPTERWIKGITGEDQEAQETLLKLVYMWSRHILYARYADLDAEDIMQQTVVDVWQIAKAKHTQCTSAFVGWLRVTTIRKMYEIIRKKLSHHHDSLDRLRNVGYEPAAPPPIPPDMHLDQARLDALQNCLDQLDQRQRAIIECPIDEVNNVELAARLGISRQNLNQIRHRVRLRLKACMEAAGYYFS